MTSRLFYRAALIWLLIAVLAIANGALRDIVFAPLLGRSTALPLSGITLSIIVLAVTHLSFHFINARTVAARWMIGMQWVAMTLLFEFGFGYFVIGKSWGELLQTFNVLEGNLFLLVIFVSLIAPTFIARIKRADSLSGK